MSALELSEVRRAERRWAIVGVLLAMSIFLVQTVAGIARGAVTDEPSVREKVQTCLTERRTPFDEAAGDAIALSAARGALRVRLPGNSVTVSLGGSDRDAERVHETYASVATADVVRTRLDRRRKVVFLWEHEPTASQREFMYLCTLDAQE